jgi:hypothetical protein
VPGVDWAEGLTYREGTADLESWKNRTWEKTLSFVREEQSRGGVDFVLGYLYPQQVEESATKELQRTGIPCVNFFCDNVREFRRVPRAYHPFDLHWVPEYEALPMYRRAGLPYIHSAMPCWVPEKLRTPPLHETEPATFIGSGDILRRNLIGQAMLAGADLAVRGPGWRQSASPDAPLAPGSKGPNILMNQIALVGQHGFGALAAKLVNAAMPLTCPEIPAARIADPVFGDEYFRVTREASVTVGVNRVPVTRRPLRSPLSYSRLRDIEAPMLGACYLTEHTAGIEHLYDTGKEIETYHSAAELADKLKQLLADAPKRKRLRLAGQRRALSEHTVAAGLGKICSRLGISQKNNISL